MCGQRRRSNQHLHPPQRSHPGEPLAFPFYTIGLSRIQREHTAIGQVPVASAPCFDPQFDWRRKVPGNRATPPISNTYYYAHVDDLWRKGRVKRAAGLVKVFLPFRTMVEWYGQLVSFLRHSFIMLTYHPAGDPWDQRRSELDFLPRLPTSNCKSTSPDVLPQPGCSAFK